MHWLDLLATAAVAIGTWIGSRLLKPTDLQKASHLALIAEAAAALVVSTNPKANWPILLDLTIHQIDSAAGLPTHNAPAIQRAAAAALVNVGKTTVSEITPPTLKTVHPEAK